jgi:Mor family transcriptional regulator
MILELLKTAILSASDPDQAVTNIQALVGGQEIYIPALTSREKREQVRQAFTGNNHAAVCQKFGISLRTLYRLLE